MAEFIAQRIFATQREVKLFLRTGPESQSRHLRGDDGFEDREGHQAPFTLRRKNLCGYWSVGVLERKECSALFDCADDGVEVRPVTGFEFGVEQFSISANLESAPTRRNEGERFDPLAELENFGRQTDGLRRVVSNHAVFDRDLGSHSHSFPKQNYRCDEMRSRRCRDSRPLANTFGVSVPNRWNCRRHACHYRWQAMRSRYNCRLAVASRSGGFSALRAAGAEEIRKNDERLHLGRFVIRAEQG